MANEHRPLQKCGQPEERSRASVLTNTPAPEQYIGWLDELRKCTSSIDEMQQQIAVLEAEREQQRQLRAAAELELALVRRVVVVLSQLNLARTQQEAIAVVHDVLTNLIGTEQFACVMFCDTAHRTFCSMGVSDAVVRSVVGCVGSSFHRMISTGETVIRDNSRTDQSDFIAAIPLRAQKEVVGAVVIFNLLPQKNGFERRDFALFETLTQHAAGSIATKPQSLPQGDCQ